MILDLELLHSPEATVENDDRAFDRVSEHPMHASGAPSIRPASEPAVVPALLVQQSPRRIERVFHFDTAQFRIIDIDRLESHTRKRDQLFHVGLVHGQ